MKYCSKRSANKQFYLSGLVSLLMSGCILTVSRTYIFLHTSNSITCILHTELEVQPRLEVCWALDTHTEAPFQKAPGQHNQDKKKLCEKENTITIFYCHGLQTQKNDCPTRQSLVKMEAQYSPLQSISFGFSWFLPLDLRLWSSFIAKALVGHLQDKLLPLLHQGAAPGKLRSHKLCQDNTTWPSLPLTALFLMHSASFTCPPLAECLQGSHFQDLPMTWWQLLGFNGSVLSQSGAVLCTEAVHDDDLNSAWFPPCIC